ncbi:MAG: hypothetical protein QXU40_00220 [Candidatus Pacearchaeota archaeon]
MKKKIYTVEKVLIFDSGPLISFSLSGLLNLIKKLKEKFKGKFLITRDVQNEVIEVPLRIKKFELEALKIKQLLEEKIIEIPLSMNLSDSEINKKTEEVLNTANSVFATNGFDIKIIERGEASSIALGLILNEKKIKNLIVIDERTARILIEDPENLKEFLEKKLHKKVNIKKEKLDLFKNLRIVRSSELVYIAYKKNLVEIRDNRLLDALLYAVKFRGVSISEDEIEEIKKLSNQR